MRDIHTNLVPFKSLHYATCANAPLLTQDRANYEKTTVKEVTLACFEPQSQMMKYDPRKGKYMACCMLYRGDVVPKEVNEALSVMKAKRTIQFVDWCPTQFKVGINYQAPATVPDGDLAKTQRACTMALNTTASLDQFANVGKLFDILYCQRAFLHWHV